MADRSSRRSPGIRCRGDDEADCSPARQEADQGGGTAMAEPSRPERRLDRLAWPELQRQASRRGSTVLWPFGAFEQHGPHLPMGTDARFADRVADAVLERLDPALPIWRLPLQSLGFSPEHLAFAGTLSLPPELLIQLVVSVGGQLAVAGFERLVLLNGHGGQIALLEVAGRQLRAQWPQLAVLPCFLWRGPEGVPALIPEPERSQGLHAGLAETSLMLHLEPAAVGAQRPSEWLREAAPPGWSLEGAAPCSWLSDDISASGVIGSAQGASAQLGAELFECLVSGWQRRLDALLRSDWPPRRGMG
jgi:creatinine amidohydrolase